MPPLFLRPESLHIPDGFLSPVVAMAGWILAAAGVAYALRQTNGQLGPKQVPLLGVLAAFIFAAQAINFPIAGGTSGHLLGGALVAILTGPWAAVLIMTSVIGVQALIYQDGGLLVLGFNIANMGILTAFTGYLVYRMAKKLLGAGRDRMLIAGSVAAWLSVMVGAAAAAIELAISGAAPLALSLPAMTFIHAWIGIGEALITAGALAFIQKTRPDLLGIGEAAPAKTAAHWAAVGLGIALAVAAFSPLASGSPDGLNRVAADLGFDSLALAPVDRIFSDYAIPMIANETVSKILAVGLGTLIVFALAAVIARLQRKASVS